MVPDRNGPKTRPASLQICRGCRVRVGKGVCHTNGKILHFPRA